VIEVVPKFDSRHAPMVGIFPRLSGIIGMHYIYSRAFLRTSLCVLRTYIESRFCNPHVVILLN
jgi:hypothetical protein